MPRIHLKNSRYHLAPAFGESRVSNALLQVNERSHDYIAKLIFLVDAL